MIILIIGFVASLVFLVGLIVVAIIAQRYLGSDPSRPPQPPIELNELQFGSIPERNERVIINYIKREGNTIYPIYSRNVLIPRDRIVESLNSEFGRPFRTDQLRRQMRETGVSGLPTFPISPEPMVQIRFTTLSRYFTFVVRVLSSEISGQYWLVIRMHRSYWIYLGAEMSNVYSNPRANLVPVTVPLTQSLIRKRISQI